MHIKAAASLVAAVLLETIRPGLAAGVLSGPIPARVVAVVDGDTLTVRARIWLGQDVTIRVRLAGIDAPELHGRCPRERALARAARAALSRRAPVGGRVALVDVRRDKYGGRVLARVLDDRGDDLGAALRAAGQARAYGGGARGGWCGPKAAAR